MARFIARRLLFSLPVLFGVTGRVGANLAHQLIERGNHVRGLVTPEAVCAVTDPNGKSWALAFTDVRDVVAGALLALESDNAIGEAIDQIPN